jgi:hypothetical protein
VLTQFGNAAVFDGETGLVWEQSPETNVQNWLNAQARCNTKTVGNRQGWRPPTLQELASLVEPTVRFGHTLPGHPFTNVGGINLLVGYYRCWEFNHRVVCELSKMLAWPTA